MAKKKSAKRFSFATYAEAVEASKAALDAFDLKNISFEEIACGYDGHELRVPGSPLFVPALFEGVNDVPKWTDYEFMVRHACVSQLQYCATDQLRYMMLQPDWLYFATHSNGSCFQNFKNDGTENWSDEIEVKREKTIRGALDFLIPWLHVANGSPSAKQDIQLSDEADRLMGRFVVETARDLYLSMKDANGRPKDFGKLSRDDVAEQTSLAIALMCSGANLNRGANLSWAPLQKFYEEVFIRGPKEQGVRRNGDGCHGGTLFRTHSDPVTNWFWEFTKLAKQRGWLKRSKEVRRTQAELAHAGRGALGSFRIAMDDLQGALNGGKGDDRLEPATFGDALNFVYDNAGLLAEHGIGIVNETDVGLALRKVQDCPEACEGEVARALTTAARALVRICPAGALVPAGILQHMEAERMSKKGYPHLCTNPRSDIGKICIHESFGKLMVYDLPTMKERSTEIDPAVVCDDNGMLLPYDAALETLKATYNDFDGSTADLDAAVPQIAAVNADAALSFHSVITKVFGAEGAQRFSDPERIEAKDSSFTQIDTKGAEVGELPTTLEFSIGSEKYIGVFLGSYASKEIAKASAEPILKGAAAWAIYNSYSDCGKACWLQYRGLLGKEDEIRVKEWDPKKDLKPGMHQDFVDFCWEAVTADKWTHELCRYDGKGDVEFVDLQGYGDEAPPTHAWGIWRT